MKFLTYSHDKKLGSYYKYLLENTFRCEVFLMEHQSDFLTELSNLVSYDFLFYLSDETIKESDIFRLEKMASNTPGIYVCKEKELSSNLGRIFDNEKISIFETIFDVQEVLKKVALRLGIDYSTNEISNNFIPVSLEYMCKVFYTQCDFFIKLSNEKYLKIIKKDTDLSADVLVRIKKNKDTSSLFVRTTDFESFLNSIEEAGMDYSHLPESEVVAAIGSDLTFAHDTFYHLSSKFGMNERAIAYANTSVEFLYTFIEKSENMKSVWKILMKNRNFISEHSLMTAYLANAILSYTNYNTYQNSIKLSLAALLHDVEVRDEKFFNLELNLKNNDGFSQREVASFKEHVRGAVDVFNKFKNIPPDVDKILLNHHEKYDGSGYPHGLGATKLPLLSTIFNVAHELILHLIENNYSEDEVLKFISLKKTEYTNGFFKEVIISLEKVR